MTVPNALKLLSSLHMDKAEVVTDNGYYSEDNILEMIRQGFAFVTRISASSAWISPLVSQYQEELEHGGAIMHCDPKFSGVGITMMHDFKYIRKHGSSKKELSAGDVEILSRRVHVFIYYSSLKKADEDIRFREQFSAVKTDILNGAYLTDDDRKFAEKYMAIRKWGDRIIEVNANKKAYQKRMKYHGYLVLLANKEKDAESALLKYRRREFIEEDIKNYKSHTGGRHPRVWDDDVLDGQLLVQFMALSLHESFESMLRYQKKTLAILTGDKEHDDQENLKKEKNLLNWLRKNSMYDVLQWFDAIEKTTVTEDGKTSAWTTELTCRDQMFLEKLGIKLV